MKKFERELVRGWLYEPLHEPSHQQPSPPSNMSLSAKGRSAKGLSPKGLVLTHGAGSNCESPLLRGVADVFCAAGWHVLRCDLPYRQLRQHGPPFPAMAARDREGLQRAVEALREIAPGFVILGGHSYGGRQASMLAAERAPGPAAEDPVERPQLADMLLLLSYPLHPPRKPLQPRTAHFPSLRTPALFIHGTRDTFGSIAEMESAIAAIPGRHRLVPIEKAGHELGAAAAPVILAETQCFANGPST